MPSAAQLISAYTIHKEGLVRYAWGILGDHASAEDVVQDAYFRIVVEKENREDRLLEDPVGYLYRIIRNLSIDEQRKRKRQGAQNTLPIEQMDDLSENRPSPEAQTIAKDELRVLQDALNELPERTRKAFELHRFRECKLNEIADKLDISVGTAHSLVKQALDHCKTKLIQSSKS